MHLSLALFMALAPAPSDLSPVAAEYNAKAMQYYDAGQLASAVDEFYAAYQSMPDPRRDLAGREQLLGSMRATLLDLHDQTGEAAPLCRLQGILQGHADALSAAYPNDPNKLEIRSARARHEEAAQQLARFGPDACKPPPAPAVAAVIPTGPSAPAPDPATGCPKVQEVCSTSGADLAGQSTHVPAVAGEHAGAGQPVEVLRRGNLRFVFSGAARTWAVSRTVAGALDWSGCQWTTAPIGSWRMRSSGWRRRCGWRGGWCG